MLCRPSDVKLKERMKQIDVDWTQLESSLDSCERHLTATETLLLPSIDAASQLSAWMDTVEQTVKSDSGLQPKNLTDVEHLHNKFKVQDDCDLVV